jgi:hypothetical protein
MWTPGAAFLATLNSCTGQQQQQSSSGLQESSHSTADTTQNSIPWWQLLDRMATATAQHNISHQAAVRLRPQNPPSLSPCATHCALPTHPTKPTKCPAAAHPLPTTSQGQRAHRAQHTCHQQHLGGAQGCQQAHYVSNMQAHRWRETGASLSPLPCAQ